MYSVKVVYTNTKNEIETTEFSIKLLHKRYPILTPLIEIIKEINYSIIFNMMPLIYDININYVCDIFIADFLSFEYFKRVNNENDYIDNIKGINIIININTSRIMLFPFFEENLIIYSMNNGMEIIIDYNDPNFIDKTKEAIIHFKDK